MTAILFCRSLDHEGQRVADDEIYDRDEKIHLHQPPVALSDLGRRADKVGCRDHVDQRRVLEQDDGLREQDRYHVAERLRQNHQPHRLAVGQAQRIGGVDLPFGDGLDAGAHDLAKIRGLEHDEGDDRSPLGADLDGTLGARRPLQDLRHEEEEPEDHQHQRDRSHQVHVAGGKRGEPLDRRQARKREQRSEEEPADCGGHGELHRVLETLPEVGKGRAMMLKSRCMSAPYFAPPTMNPGTAVLRSMTAMTRLAVMAITM